MVAGCIVSRNYDTNIWDTIVLYRKSIRHNYILANRTFCFLDKKEATEVASVVRSAILFAYFLQDV